MESGFIVYRKLENGEIVHISWRADREQAEQLARDLNAHWPAQYGIEQAASRPIDCVSYLSPTYPWLN